MKKRSKEELRNIFMEEISPNDDLFEVFCKGYELGKEKKDKYSYDIVSKYFVYDETSPSCVKTVKGGSCGTVNKQGYYNFTILDDNKVIGQFLAHRLVMVLHHADIFDMLVDHVDGDPFNNKYSNLRVVNHKQNSRNRKLRVTNWYGVSGVYCREHNSKTDITCFVTSCYVNDKRHEKSFNIRKMGIMEAFAAAVKYREDLLQEAQKDGNLYTARHKGFSGNHKL